MLVRRLICFALFLLPANGFAQGVYVQPKTVLGTINGVTRPIANATITVCAANMSGLPCSPALVSTIFKDQALTQPLSNPFTADANGNYNFAVAPGTYTVTETATGYVGYSYQLSVGGGTLTGSGSNGNLTGWSGTNTLGNIAPGGNPAWTYGKDSADDIECWNSAACELSIATGPNGTLAKGTVTPGNVGVLTSANNGSGAISLTGPSNSGALSLAGATSGGSGWSVAAVAGTPCLLLLPTASPASAGQSLQTATASGSPSACQTSWGSPSSQTSAATNFGVNLSTQTVVASVPNTGPMLLYTNLIQTLAGVGCGAGSNTVTTTVTWTSPGGTVNTPSSATLTISANGAVDSGATTPLLFQINPKAGTNITYTTSSALASAGCSPVPQYTVFAKAIY